MYKVLVKKDNKFFNFKVKANNSAEAAIRVLRLLLEKKIYVTLVQTVSC
jgi:hypothetical protein